MNGLDKKAIEMYEDEFQYLSAGQKAAVRRAYNATPVVATPKKTFVKASVGRLGVNGTPTCLLPAGATVGDLLNQAMFGFDSKKESIKADSTGKSVDLDTLVVNGETYVITPEIKSAF